MKLSKCAEAWYWRVVLQLRSGESAASWCETHRIERKSLGRWKSYFRAGELDLCPCMDTKELEDQFKRVLEESRKEKGLRLDDAFTLNPYQGQSVDFLVVKVKEGASGV